MGLRKFLFENEAVIGITEPTDYLYMRLLRFNLRVIASWPGEEIGENENKCLTIFLKYLYLTINSLCLLGGTLYVKLHVKELTLLAIGHTYITLLIHVVDISRIIMLTFSTKYREVGKEFLTKMHLLYYKDRSDYAMKTHKMVHKVCHIFTLCLLGQMLSGLTLFNAIPMYNNYAAGRYTRRSYRFNSPFEHSIYHSYPFDSVTDVKGYIAAAAFHWCSSYLTATWICMFDLFLSLMVIHLWGHLKILINRLNNFPKPSVNLEYTLEDGFVLSATKYSKEELLEVNKILKECIDYHREIIGFTKTMSDVFGPTLFVYYVFHQASGCLLLLECSQMTAQALMRYLPLTIILTQQLIQLSIIFELLGSESGKLKDAVYHVPWEFMDSKTRRMVTFFLANVQEPVHVKALGVANVGVTSMAAILKTSLSYFTFLRSK